jgi:arylsulfatase A
VIDQIAAHIDVMPTVLDLCGVALPKDVKFDGRSLRPLLEGQGSDWPERTLFTHNPINETNRYPGAVRTQRWRLVREIKGPMGGSRAKGSDDSATAWQLYDMPDDPAEEHDVARQHPEVVAKLSRDYEAWFDDVASRGLKRLPIPVGHAAENPVELHAPQAYFDGSLKFFGGPGFAHDWLENWTDAKSRVWFEIDVAQAGDYEIALRYACAKANAGSRIRVSIGDAKNEATVVEAEAPVIPLPHRTSDKDRYYVNRRWGVLPVGTLTLPSGPARLTVEVVEHSGMHVMELKGVVLKRR